MSEATCVPDLLESYRDGRRAPPRLVSQMIGAGLTDDQIEAVLDALVEDEATARAVRPWVWLALGAVVGFGIGLLL